jgi:hypothetical protein
VVFFQGELAAGRENYLKRRLLHYRINGRRMYFVAAHRKTAYVWQHGRFPNDERFWIDRLGTEAEVKPVKEGRRLRFFLETDNQFRRFREAFERDLDAVSFEGLADEDLAGAALEDET